MRITNLEGFIYKAKLKHGDFYDYSDTLYERSSKPVEICCPLHGVFSQRPNSHLNGNGCPACGNDKVLKHVMTQRNSRELFIQNSINLHGDKYTYEFVEYVNNCTKVYITCKQHGEFLQTPANHISGKGCPKCGEYGFRSYKPGSVYLLEAEDRFKVGVTNNKVSYRAKQISLSQSVDFKVILNKTFDGETCLRIETELLAWAKQEGFDSPCSGSGWTETFICKPHDVNKAKDLFSFVCSKYEQPPP